MPTLITNPSAGSNIPVPKFQVVEGGCGGQNPEENLTNLGGVPRPLKGLPLGPVPLDENGMIPASFLSDLNPSAIGVNGPRTIRCGSTAFYQVVNHDSYTEYAVTAEKGSVIKNDNHIHYTAPLDAGGCGFTINGRLIPVTAIEGIIHTPSVISPAEDFIPADGNLVVQGSVFECIDTGPVYEEFKSADIEISTQLDFSTLLKAVYGNPTSTFTFTGFKPEEVTYIRIRYHGTERDSAWSEPHRIKGVLVYVKKPVFVSPIEGGTAGTPDPSDPSKAKVVLNVQVGAFSTENLVDSFVSSDIEIATTSDFSNIVSSTYGNTGAETNWTSSALEYNTLYFIRMKHRGGSRESAWSDTVSFMTQPDLRSIQRPVAGVPYPDTTKAQLSYFIPASAFTPVGYDDTLVSIYTTFSTDPTFATGAIGGLDPAGALVSYPLQPSTTYYYAVRYVGAIKTSEWADAKSFTTAADDRIVVKPSITAPVDNATGVDILPAMTASVFATSSDTTAFTDTHVSSDWEISTQSNFSVLIASTYGDSIAKTDWIPSGLSYSTGYYARMRQNGQLKVSEWSTVVFFTVMADNRFITTPYTGIPNSGSTDVRPVINGSSFTAVNYTDTHISTDWQIATDAGFGNLVAWSNGNTNNLVSWQPNISLSYSTGYWARHRYHGNVKSSAWSSPVYFTTMADNRYIQTPTITSVSSAIRPTVIGTAFNPVNYTDTHVMSDWQISVDPGGTSLISYTSSDPNNLTAWAVNPASGYQYGSSELSAGTTYYVRHRYHGSVKVSNWSEPLAFTTPLVKPVVTVSNYTASVSNPAGFFRVSTDWEIRLTSNMTLVASTYSDESAVSYNVGGVVASYYGESYSVRARLHGTHGTPSTDWSDYVAFWVYNTGAG